MTKPVIESVAKALLIDSSNKALILKLGEHKQRPDKSYKPDLPGGLVDPGENEHDAVRREISEETGIEISQHDLLMVYSSTEFFSNENKSVTKHLFIGRVHSGVKIELSWEHSEYSWVPLDKLSNIELRSFYDKAIKYCFRNELLE